MEKIPTFFREATNQPGLFPELMPVALAQLEACKIKGLFGYGIFNPMGPTLNMISLLEHPEAHNSFIHLRMLSPFLQTSNIFAVLPANPSKEHLLDIISIAFAQSQNSDTALVTSLPTFLLHSGCKDHFIISIFSLRRHVMKNRRVFEVQKNLRLLRQFEGKPWDRAAFETKTGLENALETLRIKSAEKSTTAPQPQTVSDEETAIVDDWLHHLTNPSHFKYEMQGFLQAWSGSIQYQNRTGIDKPAIPLDGMIKEITFFNPAFAMQLHAAIS